MELVVNLITLDQIDLLSKDYPSLLSNEAVSVYLPFTEICPRIYIEKFFKLEVT